MGAPDALIFYLPTSINLISKMIKLVDTTHLRFFTIRPFQTRPFQTNNKAHKEKMIKNEQQHWLVRAGRSPCESPCWYVQVTRTNRLTPNDLQASVYSSLLDSAHVTDRGICSKIARYVSQHMLWITRAMDWDSLHATYGS